MSQINFNSQTLISNSQMTDKPKVVEVQVTLQDGSTKPYSTVDDGTVDTKLNELKDTWNTAHPDNQIDKIER